MRAALYVIGEPGVGKSTLVEALTAGLDYEEADSPFAHRRYDAGPLELGRRREAFSGTDALAMNAQPTVERFIEGVRPSLLLGEGDRLANAKFFAKLRELGYDLRIVYLYGEEVAAERRAARGSDQDDTWLAGRRTKTARLAMSEPNVQWLDASQPVAALLRQLDDPVSLILRGAERPEEAAA